MVFKQVFIINSDLSMGKGKMCAMVAHGEFFYMQMVKAPNCDSGRYGRFLKWSSEDNELMKKVVLKASRSEIIRLRLLLQSSAYRDIWTDLVYDRGLTQIPENSLTCMVIEPLEEEKCDELFVHLKLL
jgi:PTH2 family peptidyl-tRNA hydrolase